MTDKRHNGDGDGEVTVNRDNYNAADSRVLDPGRRRFAKAGVASVPVLLTLTSRPVWGNQCTLSGMLSGNLSSPEEVICEGCTPGFWGQHPLEWPEPCKPGTCSNGWSGNHCHKNQYNADGTPFHNVDPLMGGFAGSLYQGLTMMEVIQMSGQPSPEGDPYQLGAHAVAALLNSLCLSTYGYTPQQVITLYNNNYASQPEELKNSFQLLNERYCPM